MSATVYSPDELVSPPWMDLKFFEKVLRHSEGDRLLTVSTIFHYLN